MKYFSDRTLRTFLRANRTVINRLDRIFETAETCTLMEAVVLRALSRTKGNRAGMQGLADMLLLSRSGVSRLIDRMARAGYVEREESPADRRVIYAVMTERGREAQKQWEDVYKASYEEVFLKDLSPEELEQLVDLLQRLSYSIALPNYPPEYFEDAATVSAAAGKAAP
ncbi:MAG TPA: MarR family transcriptional regulator [Dehalococcoidia bacterium]|nr:MarR family transcriptional regulator [Dehalococcoidia bacterium]